MSKKKLGYQFEISEIKSPLEFSLGTISNLVLEAEKDIILRCITKFKTLSIDNKDLRSLNLQMTLDLANQGDKEAIFLYDIANYLMKWAGISKKLNERNTDSVMDVDIIIPFPSSNYALSKYYFAYLTGWISHLNKRLDKAPFLNLIRIFRELDNSEVEIKLNVLNTIKNNLVSLESTFYLRSSIYQELISSRDDSEYKEELSLIILNANSKYFLRTVTSFTHEIPQAVISFYESKYPIPNRFIDKQSKISLSGWPPVIIPSGINFLDSSEVNIVQRISINDLLRFTTHLMPPDLFIFQMNGNSFTPAELKRINDGLKTYLIEKGFLNSAGQLRLQCIYNHKLNAINPAKFKQEVNHYLEEIFIESPWKPDVIDNLVQQMCEKALNDRKTLYTLSFFNSINALALLIQTLEHEVKNPPNEIEDCFIQEIPKRMILSKLYDTLLLSNKAFIINKDFVDCAQKHQELFNLASSIVERKISSTEFNGLILQSGDPIIHGEINTKHAFYVIIKRIKHLFKISIVNGGSNADQDPDFESYDQGFGAFWICRTFITQNYNENVKIFLTHFVYRVISLRYTISIDQDDFKIILDNIYLKNEKFIGYSQEVPYELLKSNNFDDLVTILPNIDSPSFPSQTVDNCTIHNLKQALKILFNWAEHQFYLFANDLFCRYNFLLKSHSSCDILVSPNVDLITVHEETKDGEKLIEEEDYQGKLSSVLLNKPNSYSSKSLLQYTQEYSNLYKSTARKTKESLKIEYINDYKKTNRAVIIDDSTEDYIPILINTQYFDAGFLCGKFILSPALHYLDDQVNYNNQEKILIDYYYDQFSFVNLEKSITFSIVFYSLPNSFSMANKVLISQIVSDITTHNIEFTSEYATSMLGYLAISLTSFSVAVISKNSEYYNHYPFVLGVLTSTVSDIVKLSYDTGYKAYYCMVGIDSFVLMEEL